jgi:hypothetical protein
LKRRIVAVSAEAISAEVRARARASDAPLHLARPSLSQSGALVSSPSSARRTLDPVAQIARALASGWRRDDHARARLAVGGSGGFARMKIGTQGTDAEQKLPVTCAQAHGTQFWRIFLITMGTVRAQV